MPSVLDREGRVTLAEIELAAAPGIADPAWTQSLAGKDRFAARKLIVAELERLELLAKIEPHTHQVPHGDRSDVPIEAAAHHPMVCRRPGRWPPLPLPR